MKKLLTAAVFLTVFLPAVFADGIESVSISPNPVGRGDLFTLTIIVDHDNSYDVDLPLKELPPDITRWRGPYVRSFLETTAEGGTVRKVRITATFKPRSSGRMIFPGLDVIVDGHAFRTGPQLLRVGLYRNRKLYMPLEVEWVPAFDEIYTGEAVPIFLTVKNQEMVSLFDRTRVALPRDGFFEKAEGLGEIETRRTGDVVLYDIPAAAYVYTSPVAGEVKIPSAGVDSDGITGWTDNLYLKIKPVPDRVAGTGAVGVFDFTTEVDTAAVSAGEQISVRSVVSGSGNLNYLKLQQPEAEGCILVSTEEEENYRLSMDGFTGSRTVVWTFGTTEEGSARIKTADFSFFNKDSGIVETVPGRAYNVNVMEAADTDASEDVEKFSFEAVPEPERSGHSWRNLYSERLNYLWLLPGAFFYLLARLLKGRRASLALIITVVTVVVSMSLIKSFVGDGEEVRSSGAAVELYNDAAAFYEEAQVPEALHNLRTAVYLEPMNKLYSGTLKQVELQEGFSTSVSPSIPLHSDLFFYLLVVSVNIFFVAAFFRTLRPGGGLSVVIIMFGFVALLSSALIFYTHYERQGMTGIISAASGEEVFIKKIPYDTAEDWLAAGAGASVRILDESDEFRLVETGLGVKGWVRAADIITDRPE